MRGAGIDPGTSLACLLSLSTSRFQKYRGMQSLRTSTWDPYESLPTEYSRIWEFESFSATAKAAKTEYKNGIKAEAKAGK